ncbi:MAG: YcfL family protein [Kiritimatiellae bacterium]|nr:YcfL family protein [Kiritimatiellia bacterium]MBR3956869.1 YcfL family protein [Kiritimatiellia bacterium]
MNMESKIFAIASLAMFVGCVMPRTSGVWVEKGRLNIEDPAFAANIELVRDVRERTAEGFLHAQVTLQNTNREDFDCQYCFEWRAENGMIQKHQPSPWRPLVLHGREVTELDAVSILQDSADFRLKIRRCNPRSH